MTLARRARSPGLRSLSYIDPCREKRTLSIGDYPNFDTENALCPLLGDCGRRCLNRRASIGRRGHRGLTSPPRLTRRKRRDANGAFPITLHNTRHRFTNWRHDLVGMVKGDAVRSSRLLRQLVTGMGRKRSLAAMSFSHVPPARSERTPEAGDLRLQRLRSPRPGKASLGLMHISARCPMDGVAVCIRRSQIGRSRSLSMLEV